MFLKRHPRSSKTYIAQYGGVLTKRWESIKSEQLFLMSTVSGRLQGSVHRLAQFSQVVQTTQPGWRVEILSENTITNNTLIFF
jgi:hypothetical protein